MLFYQSSRQQLRKIIKNLQLAYALKVNSSFKNSKISLLLNLKFIYNTFLQSFLALCYNERMLKNSFAETQVIANVSLLAKEGSVILEQDGLIAKVTIISTMFILTPLTIIKYQFEVTRALGLQFSTSELEVAAYDGERSRIRARKTLWNPLSLLRSCPNKRNVKLLWFLQLLVSTKPRR